jgi:hypothetical protein
VRAALAVVLVCAAAPVLAGDDTSGHRDAKNQFQLQIPPSWKSARGADGTLLAFESTPSGRLLTVTRVDFPNRRAWRKDKTFYEEVERGVEESSKQYKRLARKTRKHGKVPGLDLTFRRASADYPVVAMRFLFFRRYTLIVSLAYSDAAYKAHRQSGSKLVSSFKPYFK